MKVIHIIALLFGLLLLTQTFLHACPTAYGLICQEEQKKHDAKKIDLTEQNSSAKEE